MHVTQSFPSIAVFILGAALALPAGGAQVIYDIAASDQDGNIYGETERDFLAPKARNLLKAYLSQTSTETASAT
jgi:hypothetical protein